MPPVNPVNPVDPADPVAMAGCRALVLGLGRFGGGLGVARWLLDQGAHVTVTDLLDAEQLAEPAAELTERGARLVLGGHQGIDLAQADLLVVNPAVPLSAPLVREARERDIPITSEIALLMERWPGPLVGVSGSNGKSTTVGLITCLLEAAGQPAVAGGNLGGSLLEALGSDAGRAPAPGTVAVLELSSFMLELLGERRLGPEVAVLTNLTPNHLDRHGSMEAYRDAKAAILSRARIAVLPKGDAWLEPLGESASYETRWFGEHGPAGEPSDPGPGLDPVLDPGLDPGLDMGVDAAGDLRDGRGRCVLETAQNPLAGRMNRIDLAAAILAVEAVLGDPERVFQAVSPAMERYRAPPHRLQEVACLAGIRWVDDSVSTTPESTAASLEAVEGSCILIAGGHDKGLDPEPLIAAARQDCRLVLTVGEEGPSLAETLNRRGVPAELVDTVEAAVVRAARLAQEGETVLLSPGYSSHDQFAHFEERAAVFARAVGRLGGSGTLS